MSSKVDKFLSEINQEFSPIVTVSLREESYDPSSDTIKFKVELSSNQYFRSGILNTTASYESKVEELVRKHFGLKVHFNNTGSIFWIYVE